MDAEDYSSSGAKLTWRLINKVVVTCAVSTRCPSSHIR